MNHQNVAAPTYRQALTDVWTPLIATLMTLQPYVIATAIAALGVQPLPELLCPHTDSSIDTHDRRLPSGVGLCIGAALAVSLAFLVTPYLLTASLLLADAAVPIIGSQHR